MRRDTLRARRRRGEQPRRLLVLAPLRFVHSQRPQAELPPLSSNPAERKHSPYYRPAWLRKAAK